ncbi:MAG: biotin carboxylase N-terminal domain-containing protein [Pseudomonadales bacterium]|jgi:acetyl/propionyl-CoA carboxylase alpha subunit/acetyl-CoA carboxylase alpha subunit|nr:biotin carboxylase N-terminal domain-containing protein [Pseudomonadales bacterium]
MDSQNDPGDQLFLIAENLAKDFSLFSERETSLIQDHVRGLLSEDAIQRQLENLRNLDIDQYIERCVAPAEAPGRMSAKDVIQRLGRRVSLVESSGPFYSAVVTLDVEGQEREVGFIAQDRSVANGVWMPEHHLAAARRLDEWSKRSIPVVSFMDTPGADAGADANARNQAHSISRLIAEMCNVDVPTIGIIFGLGYSGGAIPLAASNLILSVRDGVFNTIQPKGLANIARKYGLSWQECAKLVGVSAYDLYEQGNIDGVIDYVPGEDEDKLANLRDAISSGIANIERSVSEFVAENPYILDHYRRNLERYLQPSRRPLTKEASASLSMTKAPTEFTNVFGVAYRYLRYLGVRKRIRSTTTKQYGRLADAEIPKGELADRAERERRRAFLSWLQDPEKVIYDDGLARAWKNYQEKKQAVHDERGRIAQLFFGEPKKNYEDAKATLLVAVTGYLYNRWKNEAYGNLEALVEQLDVPGATRALLRTEDLPEPRAFAAVLRKDESPLGVFLRERFSHDGRKLLSKKGVADKSDGYIRGALASELNLILSSHDPFGEGELDLAQLPESQRATLGGRAAPGHPDVVRALRTLVERQFPEHVRPRPNGAEPLALSEITLLDVLLADELREDFQAECRKLLVFDAVYDCVLQSLDTIAEEADERRALSRETLGRLLDRCLERVARTLPEHVTGAGADADGTVALRDQLFDWLERIEAHGRRAEFLKSVEEWKKSGFPQLSDTLLVVVTFLFERLVPGYAAAVRDGRKYDGRINPRNIGRRKDFWNRLTIAYRDLLIQNVLTAEKRRGTATVSAFVECYFDNFRELYGDLLSSDPVEFPGFRVSIEQALAAGQTPCGIVTGIGEFKGRDGNFQCGVVLSNVAFQAGSFDMASAEKFCHLLVVCAQRRLPVICFISSGGMQTKEGAGALFSMAAVNDRITRFVRDLDLPVIVFGFGDCTGGAQASFVTHPLVQTYYFSGTNMPFAGQIVVPSNLPSHCTLSNYLSTVDGAMQGLVRHPFAEGLDEALRNIDPDIPIPADDVREVVARVLSGAHVEAPPALPAPALEAVRFDELVRPVRRTLIHARGCTAAKLVRIAQREGIEVVLVQSDPDMESTAADMLGPRDRLVCIGGNTPDESYLNGLSVVRVAELEKVDSLHPGIGFLSENAQFAELCRNHGINFIGPPVESMETMGNKSNAISTARRLGVPVVPGSYGILTHADKASKVAEEIGYPVLIKAVHGGGGKGIQVVERPEDFHDLFRQVQAEARNAFGNGDVYLEKFVTSMRHIEAQLLRDTHGNTHVLGIRDCSVQRDKQKVVEESGSTALTPELEQRVRECTASLGDAVGYVGAGTVEFILDVANQAVYFMEMNTRLQVEHPVTELCSGVDIVAQQFRIASGGSIAELQPKDEGYAIEVRLNAEKIVLSGDRMLFRPDPGEITDWHMPEAEGIDVIAAGGQDKVISPFYDSMVAQVIAYGRDRDEAADRLADYLEQVRVQGICTNLALLKRILRDPTFRSGDYDTGYLPAFLRTLDPEELISEIEQIAGKEGSIVDLDALAIEGSDELKVLSPSTGIFYVTPSPSEPEYVSVGEEVTVNQTLCQLEAMKIFSPLTLAGFNQGEVVPYPATSRYEITRINIANGQQVNAGDLLFVVKPKPAMESAA